MKITRENIEKLIKDADNGKPNLPKEVLSVAGYSSSRVRRLLNALCSNIDDANYLEVGVHLGSTFIPAMYGNFARGTCIDNWSRFGNLQPEFQKNLEQFITKKSITVISGDCYSVPKEQRPHGINVYFFDGDHGYPAQYDALAKMHDMLADRFVMLVDDWNWEEPRNGTHDAIAKLGFHVEAAWELKGDYNGSENGWWNGLWVAIISKK